MSEDPERIWTFEGPDGFGWNEHPTPHWPEYVLVDALRQQIEALKITALSDQSHACGQDIGVWNGAINSVLELI